MSLMNSLLAFCIVVTIGYNIVSGEQKKYISAARKSFTEVSMKPGDRYILESQAGVDSFTACLWRCMMHGDCLSLVYTGGGKCLLYSNDTLNQTSRGSERSAVLTGGHVTYTDRAPFINLGEVSAWPEVTCDASSERLTPTTYYPCTNAIDGLMSTMFVTGRDDPVDEWLEVRFPGKPVFGIDFHPRCLPSMQCSLILVLFPDGKTFDIHDDCTDACSPYRWLHIPIPEGQHSVKIICRATCPVPRQLWGILEVKFLVK